LDIWAESLTDVGDARPPFFSIRTACRTLGDLFPA
jgi:hypothetical protein